MTNVLDQIVETKKSEIKLAKSSIPLADLVKMASDAPPVRDFLAALRVENTISLIAEVKKASPSKGVIRPDFHPVEIATTYENNGAACISVLTDYAYFQGNLIYLKQVRSAVSIPVLRKDFIIDPYQVYEARNAGADAVLLIAECLSVAELQELHDLIVDLGMTPLVEFYDRRNLEPVIESGAQLVGVNNRDLRTFETNLQHTIDLRQDIPAEVTLVGESGIFTREDVMRLQEADVDAMLVGESLMRSEDMGAAVRTLLGV